MFSLSQMHKVKLVCALAWRENFAQGNNSVTDTKRRMQRQSNAQLKHVVAIDQRRAREGAAYHSTIRKEHSERRMPIDKQRDYAVEVQD